MVFFVRYKCHVVILTHCFESEVIAILSIAISLLIYCTM